MKRVIANMTSYNFDTMNRIYDAGGECPTVTTKDDRTNIAVKAQGDEWMTDASKKSTVTSPEGERLTIRKLTERECFRLMGFTDEEFDRLDDAVDSRGKKKFSRTAMYRFAGNSIVVDCLQHIFEGIYDSETGRS